MPIDRPLQFFVQVELLQKNVKSKLRSVNSQSRKTASIYEPMIGKDLLFPAVLNIEQMFISAFKKCLVFLFGKF